MMFSNRLPPEKELLYQHRKDYTHLLYYRDIENGEHLAANRGLIAAEKYYGKVYNVQLSLLSVEISNMVRSINCLTKSSV